MPNHLKTLTIKKLNTYIHHRKGEKKIGEKVKVLVEKASVEAQIKQTNTQFILFGVAEDIGVQANYGNSGAKNTWEVGLKALLNTQSNKYNKGNNILILGCLSFPEMYKALDKHKNTPDLYIETARKFVAKIDAEVAYYVNLIVSAGKTPIVLGGGHNNAYGIIKGYSLSKNQPINAINLDAHSDFRDFEGRHSGNGFSYAHKEGFLNKYFVFGLHENYTSKSIFKLFDTHKTLEYCTFDSIAVSQTTTFKTELEKALQFISKDTFGVEIDCDAIANVPSSAMSPSGFTVEEARIFTKTCASNKNAAYLHICEAAPNLENTRDVQTVGKLIAYLITDFIKQ
jgi:formiminoglutamase